MTGLSGLFPKSRLFGRYHLKYLSEHETNDVEVLSGAFMMMRSSALEKVGLLDEDYFMYGEDVDLSYRLTLGGIRMYILPRQQSSTIKGKVPSERPRIMSRCFTMPWSCLRKNTIVAPLLGDLLSSFRWRFI